MTKTNNALADARANATRMTRAECAAAGADLATREMVSGGDYGYDSKGRRVSGAAQIDYDFSEVVRIDSDELVAMVKEWENRPGRGGSCQERDAAWDAHWPHLYAAQKRCDLMVGAPVYTVHLVALRNGESFGALAKKSYFATREEALAYAHKALAAQAKRYAKKLAAQANKTAKKLAAMTMEQLADLLAANDGAICGLGRNHAKTTWYAQVEVNGLTYASTFDATFSTATAAIADAIAIASKYHVTLTK